MGCGASTEAPKSATPVAAPAPAPAPAPAAAPAPAPAAAAPEPEKKDLAKVFAQVSASCIEDAQRAALLPNYPPLTLNPKSQVPTKP